MEELDLLRVANAVISGVMTGNIQALIIAGLAVVFVVLILFVFLRLFIRPRPGMHDDHNAAAPITEIGLDDKAFDLRAAPAFDSAPASDSTPAFDSAPVSSPVAGGSDRQQDIENFKIFRRSENQASVRVKEPLPAEASLSPEENLRLIETEMVKLRDLFRQGHVSRDVYVDETRNLYHQAKALSKTR